MDTVFDFEGRKFFPLYDPALFFIEENIPDEAFNLFHTNERKLFHRLVRKLGRNVDESMRAVAFLLWLERISYSHNAVHKLIAWPFHLVDKLANEIAGFLRCLEKEAITEYISLHSIRKICSRHIQLFEFHGKRVKILESVAKIVSEVCVRAFKDIVEGDGEFVDVEGDSMWLAHINTAVVVPPRFYHNVAGGFPQVGLRRNSGSGNLSEYPNAGGEMSADLQMVNGSEDEQEVSPDERTIFLTFSKGYYIPELELKEFFTRIFGDFIEEIHMQEVEGDQQPMYARMVCRSSAIIPSIAPPNRKTKYSINGKRVSASKYVKRSRR